ncbi:MAG: dTDP-4-amino-4,6-dideoxygalactose transaminase [Flavobacteriales bacterium]|nr:dTDP-4-amino-4,6-dideoxygalactose transaminase [Flavobacteriales bacterium]
MIPFHRPTLTGLEEKYLADCIRENHFSGGGSFTRACTDFLKKEFSFPEVFLTTSCTAALEMAALLIDIQPGDEVIVPSYTFVSTANAFALRGAQIRFADSCKDHPNIDPQSVRKLINEKTKAIVIVHYAGMACDMAAIMKLAMEKNIFLIEDAAQCVFSQYNDTPLGSFGDLAAFSFHETKNIHCGEGGALVVNNKKLRAQAEILLEKGTNRIEFLRGKVSSYEWKSIGSSYTPSELNAAFLLAQLTAGKDITQQRISNWNFYFEQLHNVKSEHWGLPQVEDYMRHNAHHFFIRCKDKETRDRLISWFAKNDIKVVFHYLPLHQSEFAKQHYGDVSLPHAEAFGDALIRLPLYHSITKAEMEQVIKTLLAF